MDLASAFDIEAATWTTSGVAKSLQVPTIKEINAIAKGVTWVALQVKDETAARALLEHDFGFHPVAIEDALSDLERPGVYLGEGYVFVTVPIVHPEGTEATYTHVGLFVREHVLVSVTTCACGFVEDWFQRWKSNPASLGRRADMLMQELLDAAVDDYFPALDQVANQVDALEETVYSEKPVTAATAVRLRRRLLEMRRQATPIRDMLNTLLRRDTPIIRLETRTYLQDVYDHSLRVLEGIDLQRDILTSIMDAQLSVQSNRLNEVMKNMTSLATILMMMGLITGIYGMNFEFMPELHWRYGYLYVHVALVLVFFGGLYFASKIGWFTVKWPWQSKDSD